MKKPNSVVKVMLMVSGLGALFMARKSKVVLPISLSHKLDLMYVGLHDQL